MAPTYDKDQLSQILTHLDVPKEFHLDHDPRPDLAFLTALHVHMVTNVPYENLLLHYSKDRKVQLDPDVLFRKIVGDKRGRGGYCFENNLFLLYVLRSLNFEVYPVGVKIRLRKDGAPHGDYIGWVHMANIVTLADNSRWVVDVAFGGDGMTEPMPLFEGSMIRNMGTQDARLIRDFIPGQTELNPGHRFWIYQCRNGPERPWTSFYCFRDFAEWMPADFDVVNAYTGGAGTDSFQLTTVLAIRFLRRTNSKALGGEEVYGKRMLVDGVVKENTGGRTEVVKQCASEEERVKALREWFGIELTEEEAAAIKGHPTEIKA